MEKEFIPYPIALRMKQLGFDNVPCLAVWYNVPELDDYEFFDFSNHFSHQHYETQYYANKGFKDAVLAPTWYSAFAWFRERYNLHSRVNHQNGFYWCEIESYNYPRVTAWNSSQDSREEYNTYKEAELACLEKLIEIVEQKK